MAKNQVYIINMAILKHFLFKVAWFSCRILRNCFKKGPKCWKKDISLGFYSIRLFQSIKMSLLTSPFLLSPISNCQFEAPWLAFTFFVSSPLIPFAIIRPYVGGARLLVVVQSNCFKAFMKKSALVCLYEFCWRLFKANQLALSSETL